MIFQPNAAPQLLELRKIWEHAPHVSNTDLVFFKKHWFCVFREQNDLPEALPQGKLRLLMSQDGIDWQSVTAISQVNCDLTHPKLSITPQGNLMWLFTAISDEGTVRMQASFSRDGWEWTPPRDILDPNERLWRIIWHQSEGYAASYYSYFPEDPLADWRVTLWKTTNGIDYEEVTVWSIPGKPTHAALQFLPSGELLAIVQRGIAPHDAAWLGSSFAPYSEWEWFPTYHYWGHPNSVLINHDEVWVAGNLIFSTSYGNFEKTALGFVSDRYIVPSLLLPSGGLSGNPGMIFQDGVLWMTYSSSHEGRSALYLAKVQLPEIQKGSLES